MDIMKRYKWMIMVLVTVILLSFPTEMKANSAEPPGFTVLVSNPPDDMSLFLLFPDESQIKKIELQKEQKAWETYYRFFYHMSPWKKYELDGVILAVESKEKSSNYLLPVETFKTYNNLLTLDLKTDSLVIGQSPFRVPILVALRVVLTLTIESLVFILFGFRQRRSWLAFFIINIITQTGLNAMITGPGIGSYWLIGFVILEILVIIVELAAFTAIVKEHKRIRTALYTITANLSSLVLGGLLITYLPV